MKVRRGGEEKCTRLQYFMTSIPPAWCLESYRARNTFNFFVELDYLVTAGKHVEFS